MKSMSKAVMREKARLESEREKKEREEYISTLSDEERAEFFRKEEESRQKGKKALAQLYAMKSIIGKGYYQ